MNMKCCGMEMELIGLEKVATEFGDDVVECLRCNECGQGQNIRQNKFENGKLRADGMAGRYDQHAGPVENRNIAPKIGRIDRDDRYKLNAMVEEIVYAKKRVGMVVKSREQRRAELSAILEKHLD